MCNENIPLHPFDRGKFDTILGQYEKHAPGNAHFNDAMRNISEAEDKTIRQLYDSIKKLNADEEDDNDGWQQSYAARRYTERAAEKEHFRDTMRTLSESLREENRPIQPFPEGLVSILDDEEDDSRTSADLELEDLKTFLERGLRQIDLVYTVGPESTLREIANFLDDIRRRIKI